MVSAAVLSNHIDVNIGREAVIHAPKQAANFFVRADKGSIVNYSRENDTLVIKFESGKETRIVDFFANGLNFNNLIFIGQTGKWLAHFDNALNVDYSEVEATGSSAALLGILAGAAAGVGAIAAMASSGDKDSVAKPDRPVTDPNIPEAPAPYQVTITSIIDNWAPLTGTVANGGWTNDTSPELRGTLSAPLNGGDVVEILRDGYVVGTATVTGQTWTFTDVFVLVAGRPDFPMPNPDFTVSYTVRVVGADGAVRADSDAYVVNVDIERPTQTVAVMTVITEEVGGITPIPSGGVTIDTTPRILGTITAPLSEGEHVVVLRNGVEIGTAIVSGSNWAYDDNDLKDGQSYVYTARIEDAAGNYGAASDDYTITIDKSLVLAPGVLSGMLGFETDDIFTVSDIGGAREDPLSVDGRDGNDTFNLGLNNAEFNGHTKLLYTLVDSADPTGGNGSDVANGFRVGEVSTDPNADIIDISALLIGYQADADGPAHYINGIATIDAGDNIADYLSVAREGNNTILHIDRDGQGSAFASQTILTMVDTNVDLATLLANHQIIV